MLPSGSHFSRGSAVFCRSQFSRFERALTSAPCASSSRTIAGWLCAAAHISAVCPCQLFARIDRRAVRQQHVRGVDVAGARRRHQRGLAFGPGGVGVGAGLQQPLDHRRVAVDAGQIQRRDAVAVRRLDVGAGANEPIRACSRSSAAHGPVQRRRAVGFRRVDEPRWRTSAAMPVLSPAFTASMRRRSVVCCPRAAAPALTACCACAGHTENENTPTATIRNARLPSVDCRLRI